MDRLERIHQLTAQKLEIDGELKSLKATLKAESAALRKPRKKQAELALEAE